jgi:hypothetical protein
LSATIQGSRIARKPLRPLTPIHDSSVVHCVAQRVSYSLLRVIFGRCVVRHRRPTSVRGKGRACFGRCVHHAASVAGRP